MFTCSCVDKIKEEPKFNKNQQDEEVQASITKKNKDDILMAESTDEVPSTEGPTLSVHVSCCMTNISYKRSEEEAMTAYNAIFI